MGEKSGEVLDPSGRGIDYVDSLDIGYYGSDLDGDMVCRKSRYVCFDPNNQISYLELGIVFRGPEEFKTALAKYAVKKGLILSILGMKRGGLGLGVEKMGALLEYMLL
ncbi:hypothetical protein PVK06_035647 [Gossypium arboreum]|uniref:Uncharacterized protein n=1 Tax=Gossypium arboreum TaxID=29729 RepID=A0ABR0NHC8_GOSAR|nr:hypothetical protein PVK06_035647 [Gossypium arboreum]